jgi:hypothetical protein
MCFPARLFHTDSLNVRHVRHIPSLRQCNPARGLRQCYYGELSAAPEKRVAMQLQASRKVL